ncbi:MAG: hypothetical protein AABZ12_03610 [Planctomycetota bacterium]
MAEERLKLIAEALGFTESARAVDVLAEAQKRLAETSGKLETAKTTGSVSDVAALTKEQQKLGEAVGLLGETSEVAGAGMEQLQAVLRTIDPRLEGMVSRLGKVAASIGDLATQNVNLKGAFESVTTAISKNGSALALLGAGGAVAVGILAITHAVARMGEEFERVTAAIKRQQEAMNELKRAEQERRRGIEEISDTRREGGFTADQSRAATATAERIGKRFAGLKPEAINEAVANLFGGEGIDDQALAEAAFLIQAKGLEFGEKDTAARRLGLFGRMRGREAEDVGIFFGRETAQKAATPAEALAELASPEGMTVDIEKFIQDLPGLLARGQDVGKVAEIVRVLRDTKGFKGRKAGFIAESMLIINEIADVARGQGGAALDIEGKVALLEREGVTARGDEVRTAEFALQQLQRRGDGSSRGENITIINNQNQNAKFIGPDAAAQRARTVNGQGRARAAEGGL